MKRYLSLIAFLLVFSMALPVLAKKKKTATPTPAPTPKTSVSSNTIAMQKALRFYVYEKSSDVVNDVTGMFDSKAQKITLKCELKNQTQKEIHGVRGTIRFTTLFGEFIADVYIESTTVLPSGEVVGINWDVPTDRLKPEAFDKLKKAQLDQIKQTWHPSMVVFTDGTILK